jgi:glycosyltransferase EpsF
MLAAKYIFFKSIIKSEKFFILNNTVDTNIFLPLSDKTIYKLKSNLNISKNVIVLGNAARFTSVKNHKFLIEIFQEINKIKDSVLLLAGEGETLNDCKDFAKSISLEDKVFFLLKVSEMNEFYNILDYFILPSKFEGLPVSVIEAQATGLNVIISDSITKEVDLDLGLVKFISLKKSAKEWAIEIINQNRIRISDVNLIQNKFSEKLFLNKNLSTYIWRLYYAN